MRPTGVKSIALTGFFVVACGGGSVEEGDPQSGPWHAVEETVGDTLVVRTLSGSERGVARLAEELRIGAVEGEEYEMFGRVGALAVTPGGDILIYDAQASAVRRFAPSGSYLGTIGGAGSGPGEYRNVAGLGVLHDGRIVANDFGNGRFNIYGPSGEFVDNWFLRPAIAAMRPVHMDEVGHIYLHDLRLRQMDNQVTREEVLIRIDRDGGSGDTILVPHSGYRSPGLEVRTETGSVGVGLPFAAQRFWTVTSDGAVVGMIGNRYAVDVHHPDGAVRRITRTVEPIPVSAEERAAEEERLTPFFQREVEGWRWDGPQIPSTKPPISWVHSGRDGTLWVRIAQPGAVIPEEERRRDARTHIRERVVFDVFENDGRFMGQVLAPDRFQLQPYPVFDRDHVWAVTLDEQDVQFVARYRIEWN